MHDHPHALHTVYRLPHNSCGIPYYINMVYMTYSSHPTHTVYHTIHTRSLQPTHRNILYLIDFFQTRLKRAHKTHNTQHIMHTMSVALEHKVAPHTTLSTRYAQNIMPCNTYRKYMTYGITYSPKLESST